jgi:mevalonate kinase
VLLTSEYAVLDGALALGLPLRRGQWLRVRTAPQAAHHSWQSRLMDGTTWFEGKFAAGGMLLQANDLQAGKRLETIFQGIEKQRPGFWSNQPYLAFETQLEFPREWGLGSSSTLIAGIARWAGVDPFQLLEDTFGGSGYDIACANSQHPVLFQRRQGQPSYVEVPYQPTFSEHISFAFLGRKQDSRAGIARYRSRGSGTEKLRGRLSELTLLFLQARTATEATLVLEEHEALLSKTLGLPTVKEKHFPNFPGVVKSLGAWGGDFVMAISEKPAQAVQQYFKVKGFETVFNFRAFV